MTDLTEFQRLSATTAFYPGHGTGSQLARQYCALGLLDEAGEVAGKVKKAMRDDGWLPDRPMSPERAEAVRAECGDVLWYLAQLLTETGTTLTDPGPVLVRPSDSVLALALELPRHAVDVMLHSTDGGPAQDRAVTRLLEDMARTAWFLGTDLEAIASANLDKLAGRASRGVLTGDGDDR